MWKKIWQNLTLIHDKNSKKTKNKGKFPWPGKGITPKNELSLYLMKLIMWWISLYLMKNWMLLA